MKKCVFGAVSLLMLSPVLAQSANQPADISRLRLIDTYPTSDPSRSRVVPAQETWDVRADARGRCLSSPFETPGQSWEHRPSSGGVSEANWPTVDPRNRGKALGGSIKPAPASTVQVLIVDHFAPVQITRNETGTPKTYTLSHGNLVLNHLRAVLAGAGFSMGPDDNTFSKASATISIVPVEVGEPVAYRELRLRVEALSGFKSVRSPVFPTSIVVDRIQSALRKTLRSRNTNVVVNMSLAMIPCELQQNYERSAIRFAQVNRLYTFAAYMHDLYTQNPGNASEVEFEQGVLNPPNLNPNEPLRKFVTDLHGNYPNAVVVAASGNYGLPISTMPAAWKEVVSVGGATVDGRQAQLDPTDAPWPDRGDVMEVGQWLQLQPADMQVGCTPKAPANCALQGVKGTDLNSLLTNFKYRGTSFSAPTVTAYVAMAMLTDQPNCVPSSNGLPSNLFRPAAKLANIWLPNAIGWFNCP